MQSKLQVTSKKHFAMRRDGGFSLCLSDTIWPIHNIVAKAHAPPAEYFSMQRDAKRIEFPVLWLTNNLFRSRYAKVCLMLARCEDAAHKKEL
jgi:hypothetical protein